MHVTTGTLVNYMYKVGRDGVLKGSRYVWGECCLLPYRLAENKFTTGASFPREAL